MYAPHNAADEMYEDKQVESEKCKLCDCNPCTKECDDECNSCCCDEDEDWDDENTTIVRGKWVFDGCKSIDEMVEALKEKIAYIEQLKKDGWEVQEVIYDDYAFLYRTPQ